MKKNLTWLATGFTLAALPMSGLWFAREGAIDKAKAEIVKAETAVMLERAAFNKEREEFMELRLQQAAIQIRRATVYEELRKELLYAADQWDETQARLVDIVDGLPADEPAAFFTRKEQNQRKRTIKYRATVAELCERVREL